MPDPHLYTTCAFCPRLCRHVCPVAVATSREAATPSAMMTAAWLGEAGAQPLSLGLAAASLCVDCGACTTHCKVHVPVSERLIGFRAAHGLAIEAAPLAAITGPSDATHVCVLTSADDWSSAFAAAHACSVCTLRTDDALGHAAWRAGSPVVLPAVAAHIGDRIVVTGSGAVAAVARAAGLRVERLKAPDHAPLYRSCLSGGVAGPDRLACCGGRPDFIAREPSAAADIAQENIRLWGDRPMACDDELCACWLAAHGAAVVGPLPEVA